MRVPYIDLTAQYRSIKEETDAAIRQVLEEATYTLGPAVERFEKAFARYCGADSCMGVNNGTNALILALRALDVGPGNEVITSACTFVATVAAILWVGAKPVLVDVEPATRTLDPERLETAVSDKTKAVIPVHLYGLMADMDRILGITERRNITVIEDAAQAHGAVYRGQRAGSIGRAACFSFYPSKNLGAFGEAGAVTTSDVKIEKDVRILRDQGSDGKNNHVMPGLNARMEGIQGAVLGVKLKHLDNWNEARRTIAGWYSELLGGSPLTLPTVPEDGSHVFHIYAVETTRRKELQAYLHDRQIETAIHYPVPVHLQPGYRSLGYAEGIFPVAERLARQSLSLPMYPELGMAQVEYVCEQIKAFFDDQA